MFTSIGGDGTSQASSESSSLDDDGASSESPSLDGDGASSERPPDGSGMNWQLAVVAVVVLLVVAVAGYVGYYNRKKVCV